MIEFQPRNKKEPLKVKVQIGKYPLEELIITKSFKSIDDLMDYVMNTYWYRVGKNKRMYA